MVLQNSFLQDHPVAERINVGIEHGRPIVIEHIPPGQLPERLEALGLADEQDWFLFWHGDTCQEIGPKLYERMKAGRAQV